jgi:hypothetical protein
MPRSSYIRLTLESSRHNKTCRTIFSGKVRIRETVQSVVYKRIRLTQTPGILRKRYEARLDCGSKRFQYSENQCVRPGEGNQHVYDNMKVGHVAVRFALMQQEKCRDEDNNSRDRPPDACAHVRSNVLVQNRI